MKHFFCQFINRAGFQVISATQAKEIRKAIVWRLVMMNPPYGVIAELLKKGQVIPFLGAGANMSVREPPNAEWNDKTCSFLPNGSELSRFLADKVSFPSLDDRDLTDLARVASFYEEAAQRGHLRAELRGIFDREYPLCPIHKCLAEIEKPLLIVTTNYDALIEDAFKIVGRPFDLVVHPTDRKDLAASVLWWKHGSAKPMPVPPNQLHIDLEKTTVIYKMHGTVMRSSALTDLPSESAGISQDTTRDESTVDEAERLSSWDSYVVTEDDYVDFLSLMTMQMAVPALFARHFRDRNFLFLGYGLRDWNFRVVLRNLRKVPISGGSDKFGSDQSPKPTGDADEPKRSWAIQYEPSDLEKELWNRRGIKIYDQDINKFVEMLRSKM